MSANQEKKLAPGMEVVDVQVVEIAMHLVCSSTLRGPADNGVNIETVVL